MDATRPALTTIPARFCGPPGSANGGYTAGLVAAAFLADHPGARAVEVTLRRPPPLETALRLSGTDDTTSLHEEGGDLVAQARAGMLSTDPVEMVSVADAREAEHAYAGLREHPFPTCFTCGPDRAPGDGLRLHPGPVSGGRTACTWTPDAALADEEDAATVALALVWASLDCPGGWTTDIAGRPMVLGRITAEVDAPAQVGERHVVMGRLLGREGRKTFTATTLYDSDGRVVARAEQVWIEVDPALFSARA